MIILPNGSQKHIQIYRYAGTLQTEAAPFALGNPPTHTRPIFLFYPHTHSHSFSFDKCGEKAVALGSIAAPIDTDGGKVKRSQIINPKQRLFLGKIEGA